MTGWDIQPAGVYRTLEHTREVAGKFQGHTTSLATHLESAAKHAGTVDMGGGAGGGTGGHSGGGAGGDEGGGLVGTALARFLYEKQTQVQFLVRRTGKSVDGAGAATASYLQGDEEMAADCQRTALEFPKLDMPGTQQKGK